MQKNGNLIFMSQKMCVFFCKNEIVLVKLILWNYFWSLTVFTCDIICSNITSEWPFNRPVSKYCGNVSLASSSLLGSEIMPGVLRMKYTQS